MEKSVKEAYPKIPLGTEKVYCPKVNLIRYADVFIVTAENRETLEDIKTLLIDFLAQ